MINSILNIKPYSLPDFRLKNRVSFCAKPADEVLPDEIIKPLSDKEKIVSRRLSLKDGIVKADYLGVFDNNDNIIRDMRFDRRYNEIRAIEYKKSCGLFKYIQNSLSVSFDKNGNIRNVYMINKDGDTSTHSILTDKYGFSANRYDENNSKTELNDKEKQEQLNFFIEYTKNILKEAQNNDLINSEGVLDKFSEFLKNVL